MGDKADKMRDALSRVLDIAMKAGGPSGAPCQGCGEMVPEDEALGDPDSEWLCPDCFPQSTLCAVPVRVGMRIRLTREWHTAFLNYAMTVPAGTVGTVRLFPDLGDMSIVVESGFQVPDYVLEWNEGNETPATLITLCEYQCEENRNSFEAYGGQGTCS